MKKVFLLLVPLITIAGIFLASSLITPETIQSIFQKFGSWTLIIYILAYCVAVWIPHLATIMTIVGGLLFGPLYATIIVILLSTIASAGPFLFTRKVGHKKISQWIERKGYSKYAHQVNKNSFLYVLYLRLLPLLPYELQNYLIGLTNISLKNFFLATFLGLFPGTLGLALLGETIADTSQTNIVILMSVFAISATIPWILKRYKSPAEVLEK